MNNHCPMIRDKKNGKTQVTIAVSDRFIELYRGVIVLGCIIVSLSMKSI
jgi:hypothetical protein